MMVMDIGRAGRKDGPPGRAAGVPIGLAQLLRREPGVYGCVLVPGCGFPRSACTPFGYAVRMRAWAVLLLGLLPAVQPAGATEVFRCVDARGRLAFQDTPCPRGSVQKILDLPTPGPAQPAPPLPATPRTSRTPPPAPTAAAVPGLPLPALYRCTNASNGKTYLSTVGDPQPYLAPLGVLGMPQLPLARAYGPGGIGVSAPGAGSPANVASPIAGYYTWVQDRCVPLPRSEVCADLRHRLDALEGRISRTFQFDRPPLQAEARTLRAQLQSCR